MRRHILRPRLQRFGFQLQSRQMVNLTPRHNILNSWFTLLLLLSWSAEANKADALMEIPFRFDSIELTGQRLDQLISHLKTQHFFMIKIPALKECELKTLCINERTAQ